MTDEELLALYHKEALNLSYYNAAEGDSYLKEVKERNEAREKYISIKKQVLERGLELPKGNYLI